MARTHISAATHAIVGTDAEGGGGVLHWHDNELDAHRDVRAINRAGGSAKVVPAPGGEMDPGLRSHVKALVFGALSADSPPSTSR